MRPSLAPVLLALTAGEMAGSLELSETACQQALEHRVGGLVTSALLKETCIVPAGWDQRFLSADAMGQLWHELQLATMDRVSEQLNAIGIEHMYIKGAANAERWYDRTGERTSVDVDLVLSPLQSDRWLEALSALSPTGARPYHEDSPRDLIRELAVKLKVEGGCDLDVHFDVLKYGIPSCGAVEIWERRELFTLSTGQQIHVLDPTTALAQQLIELNRDRFRYLQSFAEIARIIARENIDWRYLEELASREGVRVPLFLSLGAVIEELQLPGLKAPPLAGWRVRAWRATWPKTNRLRGDIGAMRWRHRERLLPFFPGHRRREALRSVWSYFFPPRRRLESLYPGSRGPYLWRNFWPRITHARIRRAATSELGRRGRPQR